MDYKIDDNNSRNNMMYYNQLLRNQKNKKNQKVPKPVTFSSQKIDFSKYSLAPAGYEGIMYTLYFLIIPYIFGAVFLFFVVAHGNFSNFKLLDASAFLIVWVIGYEIVASILLLTIFISYLKYDVKAN